jgi:hypothetical protein
MLCSITTVFLHRVCPERNDTTVGLDVLEHLTNPCWYDRWSMPGNVSEPLPVTVSMHINFLGPIETSDYVSGMTARGDTW